MVLIVRVVYRKIMQGFVNDSCKLETRNAGPRRNRQDYGEFGVFLKVRRDLTSILQSLDSLEHLCCYLFMKCIPYFQQRPLW